ncbi:MAG: DASH family cryptochrome, partial [Bacteroidota bacterium]
EKGADLIIRHGRPEEVIPELAEEFNVGAVYAHQEVTDEELQVESALEDALFAQSVALEWSWGATLFHRDDLPMPVNSLPEVFTPFRKQTERYAQVREVLPTPDHIHYPDGIDAGEIPTLEHLGVSAQKIDPRGVLMFKGGEIEGLERLHAYFWEGDHLRKYKETRNGMLGADYSSKFSPWLAHGCLSPRMIYQEIKRYEDLRVKNNSTYWLIFELIWRDFFRFICKKHGNKVFYKVGIKGYAKHLRQDWELFDKWAEGKTGFPLVDANMRELNETGFMSNRGRQNVASFLVNDLKIDWRMGAEYFESLLLDYDVCSNWGNWNYVAGVGNDPRENRYFNTISQSKRYDAKGDYLRHWLPELSGLPSSMIHFPADFPQSQLRAEGVTLGGNYPYPVANTKAKA